MFTRREQYTADLERYFAYIWETEAVRTGGARTTLDPWVFNNVVAFSG